MMEQKNLIWRCRHCRRTGPREAWTTYHGLLACSYCLHSRCIVDVLETLPAPAPVAEETSRE